MKQSLRDLLGGPDRRSIGRVPKVVGTLRRHPRRTAEVVWHLAQLIPRLPLSRTQRRRAVAVFEGYLRDVSAIVRTCAMQALAEFASADAALRSRVLRRLRRLTATGTPAMRARGRRLLSRLIAETPGGRFLPSRR